MTSPAEEHAVTFPEGFVWGAATAAYQVEGGASQDGRGQSIWDTFSHTAGRVLHGDTGDIACDHFNRLEKDLGLIANLGLSAYRFSVSWPRVQPDGKTLNSKGLDFYARLVDGLLERGVKPALTLYHWDLPQALEDAGGWQSRQTADRFADYASVVAEELADRVPLWITLNEPWVASWVGYGIGRHAPGIRDLRAAATAHHHLLLAHGRAMTVLRQHLTDGSQAGITLSLMTIRPASDHPDDVQAAGVVDAQFNLSCADAVLRGEYPANLGVFSDVWADPDGPVRPGDLDVISQPVDFLGVNSYHARIVAAPGRLDAARQAGLIGTYDVDVSFGMQCADVLPIGAPTTATGWPVNPDGLTQLLCRLHARYGIGVYVTENGAAYHDYPGPDGAVHDPERVDYLLAHLRAVRSAIDQGADVRGYFAWSLLDNFEWSSGYSKRFGLVYVDYPTSKRIPKDSYHVYRRIIATSKGTAVINTKTLSQKSRQLIEGLIAGDLPLVRSLYHGRADIDDPFAGHQVDGAFEHMVTHWRPTQDATGLSLTTTHTTEADGYVAAELELRLRIGGQPRKLSIVAVSEVAPDGSFERTRLYYRRANIDGQQHYRDRMLQEEIRAEFDPIIEKYQKALLERNTKEFIATFAEDGYFDGHGGPPDHAGGLVDLSLNQGMGVYAGHDELYRGIGQMMEIGQAESPKGRLEHVNAFSDGTTTVLEFNILRPEENHVHAGVACYEVNSGGLLQAARVYDEAW
jgi:beta-glucosidase